MTLNEDPKPSDEHQLVLVDDAQDALQQVINSIVTNDRDYNLIMMAMEHYAVTVGNLVHHLAAERDGAIDDLAKLEEALENEDTDHPLVNEFYERIFDEGYESGAEDQQSQMWEDTSDFDNGFEVGKEAIQQEIQEALAVILGCDESDLAGFVDSLTDYRALINDEDALKKLNELAIKANGADF